MKKQKHVCTVLCVASVAAALTAGWALMMVLIRYKKAQNAKRCSLDAMHAIGSMLISMADNNKASCDQRP